jgi:hypothetical protein
MKLGYMMLLVAVGAMLVIAPSAMGAGADKAEKGHGDKNAVYGKVTKIDGLLITIAVKGKKDAPAATEKIITTNSETKFFIGETAATIADVKVDARIAVTLVSADSLTAGKIVIMPAGGEHKKTK